MNKSVLTLLFLIISSTFAYSQIFESEQKFDIRDSSVNLLKKYVKYADLTEDGISINEEYGEVFRSLFTEDANIVNDLYGKKEVITSEEYVKMIEEKYEGGIEVKAELDSSYFKGLKKVEGDLYSVQVDCRKFTVGLNNQYEIVRKDIMATFTILFKYKNNTLYDFKIKEIISKEIVLKRQSDEKMKGLYVGLNINALSGKLQSDNNFQYYNRSYNLSPTLSAGIFTDYYFSSNIAVSVGLDYFVFDSNFNTQYNNENNNNLVKIDMDDDSYFLYINSDFNEQSSLEYVSIPIKFKYRHQLYNNISIFTSLGFSTSYLLSSRSYVEGHSNHSAWYEQYNLLVDEAQLYNLGEYDYHDTFDLSLADLFFSGILEVGVSIPVKKSSYFNIGASINHSFSNLKYDTSTYRDDYINLHGTPKSLFIQSGGIFISYLFKL